MTDPVEDLKKIVSEMREELRAQAIKLDVAIKALKKQHEDWNDNHECIAECTNTCMALKEIVNDP